MFECSVTRVVMTIRERTGPRQTTARGGSDGPAFGNRSGTTQSGEHETVTMISVIRGNITGYGASI